MYEIVLIISLWLPFVDAVGYGTRGGQEWNRTTNVLFGVSIEGWGLSSKDTLRFVEPGHSCTENSGDVSTLDSTLQWNCPDISVGCSRIRTIPPVDISVQTFQWDCTSIDSRNVCSGLAPIVSVDVDSAGVVRLVFSDGAGLLGGEWIRLGQGIMCGSDCDSSRLNILMGGTTDASSDAYNIGNQVYIDSLDSPGTVRLLIPSLGGATPAKFIVDDALGYVEWFRTDVAQSRVELKGLLERTQINVCWNGGGRPGGYTSSAGILDIFDAGIMAGVGVEPITRAPDAGAIPLIVYFSTSASTNYMNSSAIMGLRFAAENPADLTMTNWDGSLLTDQSTCTSIFKEMWSSNSSIGFPYPERCTVTTWTVGQEITVQFQRGNGLQPSTDYKVVLKALLTSPDGNSCCLTAACGTASDSIEVRGCQLITIRAIANMEESPFVAIEIGRPLLPNTLRPELFVRGPADPFLSTAMIEGGSNGLLDLASSVTVSLEGGVISPGNYVRLIFPPFTEWSIGDSCQATIDSIRTISCSRNASYAVMVQLPSDDFSANAKVTLSVSGLSVPLSGFFPRTVGIELLDSNQTHAFYTETTSLGVLVFRQPDDSVRGSIAKIVAEHSLTDFSFQGNAGKEFFIKIIPDIDVPVGSVIDITLPTGWVCNSVSPVTGTESFWSSVLGSPYPSGRGLISSAWTVYGNETCRLVTETSIYGSSSLFVYVNVNFPLDHPVSGSDSVFELSILSDGILNAKLFFASEFEINQFVSSIAVLGRLRRAHIEPIGFSNVSDIAVFFQTQQAVLSGGFVRITPPASVTRCTCSDLNDYIYSARAVSRVPGLGNNCTISNDELFLPFTGSLKAGHLYSFRLGISLASLDGPWSIRTTDNGLNLIDGTDSATVPFLEGLAEAYGNYSLVEDLEIEIADMSPFSLTSRETDIKFSWMQPMASVTTPVGVRVSVPIGLVLDPSSITTLLGDVDWNSHSPTQSIAFNILTFSSVQLAGGSSYSFSLKAKLPDRPPTETLNRFRIEVGYDLGNPRPLVLEWRSDSVLPILGISNAYVDAINTIAGQETLLAVGFELHAYSQRVDIAVPDGFSFPSICETTNLSINAVCTFDAGTLTLSTSGGGLEPGNYAFYVKGVNPDSPVMRVQDGTTSCGFNMCFSISSLSELVIHVPGYSIKSGMASGGIVSKIGVSRTFFSGRDDRPLAINSFIIYFQPLVGNSNIVSFRGPSGFKFDHNCLSTIFVTDPTRVFGEGIPWPPDYQQWPVGLDILSCVGDGNSAFMTLSSVLPVPSQPYAVRVGVASNPESLSEVDDEWTVSVGDTEQTNPFSSFPLWTFDPNGSGINYSSVGFGTVNLVQFSLVPFTTIPENGVITINAPEGYNVSSSCASLTVEGMHASGCSTTCSSSCVVFIELPIEFVGGQVFVLEMAVVNPAETVSSMWTVQGPRDKARFVGPSLVPGPTTFSISGIQTEGEMTMDSLLFKVDFGVTLVVGDSVLIDGGPYNFTYNGTQSNISVSGNEIRISVTEAQPVNASTAVVVSTTNAATTPLLGNVFVCSLLRNGVLQSQGSQLGWTVVPRLSVVDLSIVGTYMSQNRFSDIRLNFSNGYRDFDSLSLQFISPLDFSKISNVSVNVLDVRQVIQTITPSSVEPLLKGIKLLFANPILTNSSVQVDITNVDLGPLPGPVVSHLLVYLGPLLAGSRLRFPAFSIKGNVDVFRKQLTTSKKSSINSLWSQYMVPRTGEAANITFDITVTLSEQTESMLVIASRYYFPGAMTTGFAFPDGLKAGDVVSVTIPAVVPETVEKAVGNFCLTSPSNTNENSTIGFSQVVYPIEFELTVVRSPPAALINVNLTVTSVGPLPARHLVVIAPEGYVFADSACVEYGEASFTAFCNQNEVYIDFLDSLPLPTAGLTLRVQTPTSDPPDNSWLVVSNQTGWGMVADPFRLSFMKPYSVDYAGMAGMRTPIAISFSNDARIRKTSKLRVFHPTQYIFDCITLNVLTLPVYPSSSYSDLCQLGVSGEYFDLVFFQDLVPGNYSFAIKALLPSDSNIPPNPTFSLSLLDNSETVVHAILDIATPALRTPADPLFLNLAYPATDFEALKWYPSVVTGGTRMGIEVTLFLNQRVSIASDGLVPIASINISFPETFLNMAQLEIDVIQTGDFESIVSSVDISHPTYIVLYVERTSPLLEGQYGFRFPVQVPYQIPPVNIWRVSLCSSNSSCSDPIVTIPYAGFVIGESNPLTLIHTTSAAQSVYAFSIMALLIFIV